MEIGRILYLKRIEKGMTQADLARNAGIPQPNLSNIEKGRRDITVSTLVKLCRAVGIHPSELFIEIESREPSRKAFVSRRSALERIAAFVVSGKGKLGFEEEEISGYLKTLIPHPRKERAKLSAIHYAWHRLRQKLSDSEIRVLLERLEDAKQRAA